MSTIELLYLSIIKDNVYIIMSREFLHHTHIHTEFRLLTFKVHQQQS